PRPSAARSGPCTIGVWPATCGPDPGRADLTPAVARQSTGSHRTADRRIDEVPLDPVARKLLDDVELSGRLNAHLLPIAEARANFEALFAGLGPGEPVHSVTEH